MFPGIGYTCDKPLLYYSAKLAKSLGYRVLPITYTGLPKNPKKDEDKIRESLMIAMRQAREQLAGINWSSFEDVVFIGKSIGTIVSEHFAQYNEIKVRHVLLTPLADTFDFANGTAIAFHGTSDPWANTEAIKNLCKEKDIPLYITENANHSLETGDIEKDIDTLKQTMAIVKAFLERA